MKTLSIACFLFICSSLLFPQNLSQRVTLKEVNENLKNSLNKIAGQTGISFIYGDSLINDIFVNCDCDNISVESALNEILKSSGLSFRNTGNNQIVIFKKQFMRRDVIAGYIMDSNTFETLPYANVTIKGTGNGAIANNSGHFSLSNIVQEQPVLHVQYIGYLSKDIFIDTLQTDGENLYIEMEQSVFKGDEITVKVNSDMVQVSENTSQFAISPGHFSNLPIFGDKDISRSLQLMPGISAANFGSSGLIIRGGLPSQNLIMLDGIKLYHINHLFGFFNAFNPEAIKDTRVIKGGYPAKYGDRLSGVIEVTARNGDIKQPHLNLTVSQAISGAVLELPLFGKGSILLSGRRSYADFVFGSLYDRLQRTLYSKKVNVASFDQDTVITKGNSNLYFYDLLGKITLLPSKSDVLTFSYFIGFDHLDNKEKSNNLDTDWKKTKSEWGNRGTSFKWYKQLTKGFNSTTSITYSDYFTRYYMSDNSYIFYYSDIYGASLVTNSKVQNNVENISFQNQNNWQVNKDHIVEFGLSQTNTKIDFNLFNEYLDFDSLNSLDFLGDTDMEKSTLRSLYMQDTWHISKDLKMTGGLRINKYNHSDRPDWAPRISMSYSITPEISINSAWGKYHQYVLQYGDGNQVLDGRTSWILANGKQIRPASAEHLILGGSYEKDEFHVNLEGYYKSTKNIPDVYNEWQYLYSNELIGILDGRTYGIDLFLQKKKGLFSGWIGYSLSKSISEIFSNGYTASFPANQDIRHKIDIVTNYKIRDWHLSVCWMYSSGRPYSIPVIEQRLAHNNLEFNYLADKSLSSQGQERNQNRLPATHQLDVSVNYNFNFNFFKGVAGISVFDLYNQQNVWYRDYTIDGGEVQSVEVNMFGITPTFFLQLRF